MSVQGYVQVPSEARRGLQTLTLEMQAVVRCLMWVLGTKWSPPQGQPTLLTAKPSLQPVPFDCETGSRVAKVGLEHAM